MHRTWFGWFTVTCFGIAALVGCAVGTEPDYSEGYLASTPIEAGTDDAANSVVMPGPSQKPRDDADGGGGGADDGGGGGGGADSGTTDAGADSGTDAGGGGTTSCASPNTCAGSTDLGSVSGDTGSGVKTATGSTSQWFKIRITEDDSDVFGLSLAMRATLTSPAGANFDLHLYLGGESAVQCTTVTKSSTTTGTDTANLEFGETGTFSNGSDDDRYVVVEVRHVSGTCSPSAKWNLSINGNTL